MTGLSCSLALTNAKPFLWGDIIPGKNTGWALTRGGEALLLREAGDAGEKRSEPKPVLVVSQAKHILGCISKNVGRSSRIEGNDYFPCS